MKFVKMEGCGNDFVMIEMHEAMKYELLMSTYKDVRKALRDNNIKYFMVYPSLDMKEEILKRMKERGNDEKFIEFQKEHFEEFINEIIEEYSDLVKNTLFNENGFRFLPCHNVELGADNPYINNQMIDYFLDNCMGNLSCLWWNC